MKRLPAQNNAPLPMPSFAERLQEGERLLWEGRPDVQVFIASARTEAARFTLPLIPFILLMECGVCWGSIPWSFPIIWVCPVLVWLVCWLGFIAQVPAQARTAAYALTSRRIFIRRLEQLTSQDWRPRIDEIPLASVRPGLRPLCRNFGTIMLGATWMTVYNTQRVLQAIPNAAAVFALLSEAQAALPESSATEQREKKPYYAKQESLLQLKPTRTLDNALQRDETLLWHGTMDAEADSRANLWTIPVLASVMAIIGGYILLMLGVWNWLWQAAALAGSLALTLLIARSDRKTPSGKRPQYVLTDRRVLVISNPSASSPQVNERALTEIAKMRLVRDRDGFGTIVFEKITRFVWAGQNSNIETYEFSFKHIADAEAVFVQIGAARQNYFAASAPKPSGAALA